MYHIDMVLLSRLREGSFRRISPCCFWFYPPNTYLPGPREILQVSFPERRPTLKKREEPRPSQRPYRPRFDVERITDNLPGIRCLHTKLTTLWWSLSFRVPSSWPGPGNPSTMTCLAVLSEQSNIPLSQIRVILSVQEPSCARNRQTAGRRCC